MYGPRRALGTNPTSLYNINRLNKSSTKGKNTRAFPLTFVFFIFSYLNTLDKDPYCPDKNL